jgi:hypothetical protein
MAFLSEVHSLTSGHCKLCPNTEGTNTGISVATSGVSGGGRHVTAAYTTAREHLALLMEGFAQLVTKLKTRHQVSVHQFDPKVDFTEAALAHNSMAVAATEMTILARSSIFIPVVNAGLFVRTVAREWGHPEFTVGAAARKQTCTAMSERLHYVQVNGVPWGDQKLRLFSNGTAK